MKRVKVRATVIVTVELDDDTNEAFVLVENGCPGTGAVFEVIRDMMIGAAERQTCWACSLEGENEIIAVEHVSDAVV